MSKYFSNVVYCNNLSIRTNRSDKTVKTLIRLLLEEQSDQGLLFVILSASVTHDTARKIQTVQFKDIFNTYFRCSNSKRFPPEKMSVDSLWVQNIITLGSYS